MTTHETPPIEQTRTGSIPVRATTETKPNTEDQPVPGYEVEPAPLANLKFRPQSSPTHARLTKRDLRDLMRLCEVEIGHCGLDQEAGRRAAELRDKLVVIHAHSAKVLA